MKVFGTSRWNITIEEKEIVRMNDKSIFYLNRIGKEDRESINSSYRNWHKSKQDAVNFLIDRTQSKIKSNKEELQRLQLELEKVLNLNSN